MSFMAGFLYYRRPLYSNTCKYECPSFMIIMKYCLFDFNAMFVCFKNVLTACVCTCDPQKFEGSSIFLSHLLPEISSEFTLPVELHLSESALALSI